MNGHVRSRVCIKSVPYYTHSNYTAYDWVLQGLPVKTIYNDLSMLLQVINGGVSHEHQISDCGPIVTSWPNEKLRSPYLHFSADFLPRTGSGGATCVTTSSSPGKTRTRTTFRLGRYDKTDVIVLLAINHCYL